MEAVPLDPPPRHPRVGREHQRPREHVARGWLGGPCESRPALLHAPAAPRHSVGVWGSQQ